MPIATIREWIVKVAEMRMDCQTVHDHSADLRIRDHPIPLSLFVDFLGPSRSWVQQCINAGRLMQQYQNTQYVKVKYWLNTKEGKFGVKSFYDGLESAIAKVDGTEDSDN